jgi:hypothetical protein
MAICRGAANANPLFFLFFRYKQMAAVKLEVFLSCENCSSEELINTFKKMIEVAQSDAVDSVEDFGDEDLAVIIAANLDWQIICTVS